MGTPLNVQMNRVARRMVVVSLLAALAWGLIAAALVLLAAAWLDLLWELSPVWRAALPWLAAVAGVALAIALAVRSLRRCRPEWIARLLDRVGETGGSILSGWELQTAVASPRSVSRLPLTSALSELAVRDASTRASQIPAARAVSVQPATRAWRNVAVLALLVALAVLIAPGLAGVQWERFAHPWNDVPPFALSELRVTPGDAEVLFGDSLDVYAEVSGEPVEQAELVLLYPDRTETLPMFHETDGRWRAVLAKVTQPASYHVQASRARSRRHQIKVITVPRITAVRIEVTPPEYAQGRGAYKGELPVEGVSGLAGAEVKIIASSNRPLAGGLLSITEDQATREVPMSATTADEPTALGQFTIAGNGRFEVHVRDIDGQLSRESISASVTLLADQRPFVRLLQPRRVSLATPEVQLPIEIAAEDDYGVSGVQLFRSLNDSRPLPMEIAVPTPAPRRQHDVVYLPLSSYGLSPGDKISLFARVEDNDPAGPKGAESAVAIVHIISQAEFEQMLNAREGLNVLMSKFRQAQRRLEAQREKIKELQKKVEESEGKPDEELRRQLEQLANQLEKDAAALQQAAKHALPFDADANLTPQLEQLAKEMRDAAERLQRDLKQPELSREQLQKALEALAGQLGMQSDLYDEAVMSPLEHLELIFPLMADQSRFSALVEKQRDLANRLRSLKGRDNEDDPALKGRMRDLEGEQRSLRVELDELLDEIENHARALPETEETLPLRESALEFAAAVRASGAAAAMADAEQGLAEFSGTRGHENALRAAEILEEFLKQSQLMGEAAGGCLVFSPGFGQCLGQTAAQLLAQMGLSMGQGSGFGAGGSGGGYSARRNSMQNVGLYGGMPGMEGGEEGNDPARQGEGAGIGSAGAGGGDNPDNPTLVERLNTDGVTGAGAATVPLRYRERVGQYFRKISEALD